MSEASTAAIAWRPCGPTFGSFERAFKAASGPVPAEFRQQELADS
jgi:hypothetical protein